MPLIVNYSGTAIKNSLPTDERTRKSPIFRSIYGKDTYFPIPNLLNTLVDTVGTYEVPRRHEGRPDLIAKDLYGTEDFWWVIFWSNNILDPFGKPLAGDRLKIVNIKQVRELLN